MLAKQKEAGKVLMAEDDHWLTLTDDDEEEDAHAHICFMARHSGDDDDEYGDECASINSESNSEVHPDPIS